MSPDPHLALPTLPGFTFRPFQGDADYAHMARITCAQSEADGSSWLPTAAWLKNLTESLPNFDVTRDLLMVKATSSGEVIAYARLMRAEQADGTRRYSHMARLAPMWRRKGIGAALLGWLESRARQIDSALPQNANTVFETRAGETQIGAVALITRAGYAPWRYEFDMTRPLDDVTPIPTFPLPEGFEIRPAQPKHYRAIWDAQVEAFRDHNGFTEPGEARYEAWLNDPTFFQPSLWKVAWHVETNDVAAMVCNHINHDENLKYNRVRGYTEDISTRRPYRKRGLARALIIESLHMFKALGMTEAALSVDAANPTGALSVYEDCGFKVAKTETVFRKMLKDDERRIP
jgi:GNAT superfamily N-acetyltransferase